MAKAKQHPVHRRSGEKDLGNIDILKVDGDAFAVEGDWGAVRISGAQPRFELRPHRMLETYRDLIHRFIIDDISADEFETAYLRRFKDDPNQVIGDEFDVSDKLFADVDEYVSDPTLRNTTGGISGDELRDRARDAYARLFDPHAG